MKIVGDYTLEFLLKKAKTCSNGRSVIRKILKAYPKQKQITINKKLIKFLLEEIDSYNWNLIRDGVFPGWAELRVPFQQKNGTERKVLKSIDKKMELAECKENISIDKRAKMYMKAIGVHKLVIKLR